MSENTNVEPIEPIESVWPVTENVATTHDEDDDPESNIGEEAPDNG